MPKSSIDDVNFADTTINRLQTGLYLGNHARGDCTILNQLQCFRPGETGNNRLGIIRLTQHAGHITENDEFIGIQRPASLVAAVSALTLSF